MAGSWAYSAQDSRDQSNSGSFWCLFGLIFHLGRVALPWRGERPGGREGTKQDGKKEVILQGGFSFKPVPSCVAVIVSFVTLPPLLSLLRDPLSGVRGCRVEHFSFGIVRVLHSPPVGDGHRHRDLQAHYI